MGELLQPIVKVAGVLVEDGKILLVEQKVTASRRWAQPGGRLELGETLEQGLIREMKEETGLDVSVDELLYVSDRITDDAHIVLISFLVSRKGGSLGTGHGTEFSRGKIGSVKMLPISSTTRRTLARNRTFVAA